jgi:hypothetical protein
MKEALSSSETPFLTRVTRRKIRKDDILHSHRRENLKSYCVLLVCCVLLLYYCHRAKTKLQLNIHLMIEVDAVSETSHVRNVYNTMNSVKHEMYVK